MGFTFIPTHHLETLSKGGHQKSSLGPNIHCATIFWYHFGKQSKISLGVAALGDLSPTLGNVVVLASASSSQVNLDKINCYVVLFCAPYQ